MWGSKEKRKSLRFLSSLQNGRWAFTKIRTKIRSGKPKKKKKLHIIQRQKFQGVSTDWWTVWKLSWSTPLHPYALCATKLSPQWKTRGEECGQSRTIEIPSLVSPEPHQYTLSQGNSYLEPAGPCEGGGTPRPSERRELTWSCIRSKPSLFSIVISPSLKTPVAAVHDGFASRENDETVSNTLTLSNGLERRTNPRSEDDFEELQYFPNFYALLTSIDSGNHHLMTVGKGNETVILGNVWVVFFLFVVSKCSSLWHTLLAGKNISLFFFRKWCASYGKGNQEMGSFWII